MRAILEEEILFCEVEHSVFYQAPGGDVKDWAGRAAVCGTAEGRKRQIGLLVPSIVRVDEVGCTDAGGQERELAELTACRSERVAAGSTGWLTRRARAMSRVAGGSAGLEGTCTASPLLLDSPSFGLTGVTRSAKIDRDHDYRLLRREHALSSTPLKAPASPPPGPQARVPQERGGPVSFTFMTLTCIAVVGYVLATYATASLESIADKGSGLGETYVDRPLAITIAFYAHISLSSLAMALGPLQFIQRLRRRRPALHRWIGRVYLMSVAAGAASSLVMATVNSAGINGFFGFGTLAVLWAGTSWMGYKSIRAGDILSHQAWMIRSFALTFAAVTLRAWLGVLVGVQLLPFVDVNSGSVQDNAYAVLPWLCWIPNLVIAEWLIRRRGLPGLEMTPSATSPEARAERRDRLDSVP
jgi:uncharacterized membrane protein